MDRSLHTEFIHSERRDRAAERSGVLNRFELERPDGTDDAIHISRVFTLKI